MPMPTLRVDDFPETRWQDQGEQRFRYAIVPHAGSWREAGSSAGLWSSTSR